MKLQKDDVRLMQFVLNEVSNIDRDIVQQAIANQPEIATEVANLKNLIGGLHDVHANPHQLQLSTAQKQKLFADTIYLNSNTRQAKSTAKANIGFLARWQWLVGGLTAVAFSVLIFNKSLVKEAQSPPRAELNHKELYAPKEETTLAVDTPDRPNTPDRSGTVADPIPNESGIVMKGKSAGGHAAIGQAGDKMKAARDSENEFAVSESPQAVPQTVAQDRPDLADGAAVTAGAAAFKESDIRPDLRVAPAKTVAIPTHASDELSLEKDSEKKSRSKFLNSQSAQKSNTGTGFNAQSSSDVSNTGLLSAFGAGGVRKKLEKAQTEISITALNTKIFTVTESLKQSVLAAVKTCLGDELKRTTLITMSYSPKDQKLLINLTNGSTTVALSDVSQQKCVSIALNNLTWADAVQVEIAIKNVSN